jgi:hypothetical protein
LFFLKQWLRFWVKKPLRAIGVFHCRSLWLQLMTALVYISAHGCGGSKSIKETANPVQRNGDRFESLSYQYFEDVPSVASDGTKLVFVSGRDSTESTLLLRIYKLTWADGAEPGTPERLLAEDHGQESQAVISADGLWVLVDSKDKILLVKFDDGQVATVLAKDSSGTLESLHFSSDSKYLTFVLHTGSGKKLYGAEVGIGEEASVKASVVDLTPEAKPTLGAFLKSFWNPQILGDDNLFFLYQDLKSQSINTEYKSFSKLNDAKDTEPTLGVQGLNFNSERNPKFSVNRWGWVSDVGAESGMSSTISGDFVHEGELPKTPVESKAIFYELASQSYLEISDPPGYQVRDLVLNKSGDVAFSITRNRFACGPDGAQDRDWALLLQQLADPSAKAGIYVLRRPLDTQEPSIGTGFCDVTLTDGTKADIDNKLTRLTVNGSATKEKFRVFLISRYSQKKDAECILKTSDNEIVAVDFTAANATFHQVASNPAPLSDSERAEPCP